MTPAMFRGVRGRVGLLVFAVTSVLYSLLATIGFVRIASGGRDSIVDRIDVVMGQLEGSLRAGSPTVELSTADGVRAVARTPSAGGTRAPEPGTLQREREITIDGRTVVLVGTSSEAPLTDSLRSLFRVVWIGVPLAAVVSGLLAGLATRQALRPVAAMTALADSIGARPGAARIPVPEVEDEVEHLARTLNEMLERIERGQEQQRRFTSDAAHELRTPLMALRGEAELLQLGAESSGPHAGRRMTVLCDRLAERIDDLLLLTTLDEGREVSLRSTDVVALVAAEAGDLVPDAAVHERGVAVVDADGPAVARAVRNLLANARRHARAEIAVTVERVEGRVWIHVDDDGPGIEMGLRDRVFERFARVDESRSSDGGGAGLGLSIVEAVASAHGGGVSVDDAVLGGARVSMWLPAG